MKKMMERFKNERGLTLVELLAVVVILAIVGTIAFVMIGNVIDNSKKDAHIANAQQLISAAKLYEVSENIEISSDGVSSNVEGELKEYIEKLVNPWTNEADETYVGTVMKKSGEYTVTMNTGKDITCTFEDKTEEQIRKGREEVCD